MRESFQVTPSGLVAAGPRLATEAEVIGRLWPVVAALLSEAADQLTGLSSAAILGELAAEGAAATRALGGSVHRLGEDLAGAARSYVCVDALVTAAERSS